jgi:hypothetical protein
VASSDGSVMPGGCNAASAGSVRMAAAGAAGSQGWLLTAASDWLLIASGGSDGSHGVGGSQHCVSMAAASARPVMPDGSGSMV